MTIRPHKKASYGPITWAKHTRSSSSCFFFFFFSRLASIISMCFQRQSDFRPVIVDPVNVGEPLYFCPDFHSCQSQFESEQIPSLRTTRGHFQLFGHIYVKSPYSVSVIIKQAREVNLFCESWFFFGRMGSWERLVWVKADDCCWLFDVGAHRQGPYCSFYDTEAAALSGNGVCGAWKHQTEQ